MSRGAHGGLLGRCWRWGHTCMRDSSCERVALILCGAVLRGMRDARMCACGFPYSANTSSSLLLSSLELSDTQVYAPSIGAELALHCMAHTMPRERLSERDESGMERAIAGWHASPALTQPVGSLRLPRCAALDGAQFCNNELDKSFYPSMRTRMMSDATRNIPQDAGN